MCYSIKITISKQRFCKVNDIHTIYYNENDNMYDTLMANCLSLVDPALFD